MGTTNSSGYVTEEELEDSTRPTREGDDYVKPVTAPRDYVTTPEGEGAGERFGESQGFGDEGLDFSQLEGKGPWAVFQILQERGYIPDDADWGEWEDDILNMPIFKGVSKEDEAAQTAGIAEDVYGFETDISRAGEDIQTAKDAYGLTESRSQADIAKSQQRLGLDLGDAGTSARSDIYGLQSQGAQQRRAGMFGKGMGGGMQALKGQDISSGMRRQGSARMGQLGTQVRGLRQGAFDTQQGLTRGIEDAGITRDASITGYNRDISDATTGLYGVGGTGADALGTGGVYGAGGSKDTGTYNLEQEADDKWEGDMSNWLAANLED